MVNLPLHLKKTLPRRLWATSDIVAIVPK